MPDEIEVSVDTPEVEGESTATTAEVTEEVGENSGSETEQKFTVTVDGAQVEVTLEELLGGYSRTADYTRKTQELAKQRTELAALAQLKQALDTDPKGTLAALAEAFGLSESETEAEELDPTERKLRELEAWRAEQEQARVEQQIIAEATRAIAENKLEVAPDELLQFALERRVMDLGTAAELLAIKQAKESTAAETAKVTAAKRTAAVVEGGKSRSAAAVVPTTTKPKTVAESWKLAKQQLGLSS